MQTDKLVELRTQNKWLLLYDGKIWLYSRNKDNFLLIKTLKS